MKDFIVSFIKNFLSNLLNTRFYWLCVILISFTFECCGMYFQYIEKLDPCEKCVYERMAYMGILISGIIGIILPKILKYPALLLWGYSAYKGLTISIEHLADAQNIFSTCNRTIPAHFWIPLDEYIPFMFRPTGQCGASMDWTLFGQDMPWWIIVIFWGYLIALGISIIWQIAAYFVKRHRSASNA